MISEKHFRLGAIVLAAALIAGAAGVMAQSPEAAGHALLWQAAGTRSNPAAPQTLVWAIPGQEPLGSVDLPQAGTRALPCGPGAVSPDGSSAILFVGAETGGLYRVSLDGPGDPVRWGDAQVLACNGRGRAAFSPDGGRWAYLQYQLGETAGPFADGVLRVLNAADGSEAARFENAVAFKLLDNGLYYAQFFTNAQGLADEVVLTWWDGAQQREVLALNPAANCNWRSVALDVHASSGAVLLSLGEQCAGGSQWRLFRLGADNALTEHAYLPSGGGYLPWAYINQVYFLPGGQQAIAVYPQGRAGNVGNLVLVDLPSNTVTLITQEVTVDAFPDGNAGHLLFSPAGDALAYVSTTANGAETLHRLTLDGRLEPVDIPAGSGGDVISTYFFRPNGDLLYVAGGANGADNSLFRLPAGADQPERVGRGKFLRNNGLAGPDTALVMEQVPPDDSHRDPAANLVAFDLRAGTRTVVVEGRSAGAFAYPLAWFQPPAEE